MNLLPILACYQSQNWVHTILASFLSETSLRLVLRRTSSLISLELFPSSTKTVIFSLLLKCKLVIKLSLRIVFKKLCFWDSCFSSRERSFLLWTASPMSTWFFYLESRLINLVPIRFRSASWSIRQLSMYLLWRWLLWMGKMRGSSMRGFCL